MLVFISEGIFLLIQSLLQNAASDFIADKVKTPFRSVRFKKQLNAAIDRGYRRFMAKEHDPAMTHLIDSTLQDTNARQLIIDAMFDGSSHRAIERALSLLFMQYMPALSPSRSQHIAQDLITLLYEEIMAIPGLREAIRYLRMEMNIAELHHPLPEYDRVIYTTILGGADQLQQSLGHHYIASAHLLYGLFCVPDGITASVFQPQSITKERIAASIQHCVKPYTGPIVRPLSEGATAILEAARVLARSAASHVTRDDHVLVAVLDQALAGHSVTLTQIFTEVCAHWPADGHEVRNRVLHSGHVISAWYSMSHREDVITDGEE